MLYILYILYSGLSGTAWALRPSLTSLVALPREDLPCSRYTTWVHTLGYPALGTPPGYTTLPYLGYPALGTLPCHTWATLPCCTTRYTTWATLPCCTTPYTTWATLP